MRVNEIFYSLQGEGYWMGRPAVFVRLSGCNLKCPFCDTEHETYTELTEQEIIDIATGYPARHIVITGGEPTLQLSATLVHGLKRAGFYVQIETNGSIEVADEILAGVDWVTCSPKDADMKIGRVDELKVIFQSPTDHERLAQFENDALQGGSVLSLQPCDVGDAVRNRGIVSNTIEYVKAHPAWRLSLQTHKLLDIR